MKYIVLGFVLLSVVLSGCQIVDRLTNANQLIEVKVEEEKLKQEYKTQALLNCQQLCLDQVQSDGENFDVGPCLSNAIAPGWVCDVAHEPRQAVDDDPANQCGAYREGTASHFVEVDGNCNVIQSR